MKKNQKKVKMFRQLLFAAAGTLLYANMLLTSASAISSTPGFTINNAIVSFNNNTKFKLLSSSGSIIINGGELNCIASNIDITGNWELNGFGVFNAAASTVTFLGNSPSTILGNTTFYNLACETPGKQLNFGAGTTQTVYNTLTLNGAVENPITLRSTIDGTPWNISFTNIPQTVSFVDVKDSNALHNTVTPFNSINSLNNNENWLFSSPPSGVFSGDFSQPGGAVYDGNSDYPGDQGSGIAVDTFSANGPYIYVVGSSTRGVTGNDYFIIKYDSMGNKLSTAVFDSSASDIGNDIALDNNGNVFVTGQVYDATNSNYNLVTVKYDNNLVFKSSAVFTPDTSYEYNAVAADSLGNIYVAGSSNNKCIIIKYNNNLEDIKQTEYISDSTIYAWDVAVDKNNNIFVASNLWSTTTNTWDYFTIKYNNDLVVQTSINFDGGSEDKIKSITVDTNGNVFVTGESYNSGNNDCLTIKYSNNLVQISSTVFNAGNNDSGKSITATNNGDIYVTGEAENGSNKDYLTIRYNNHLVLQSSAVFNNGNDDSARGIDTDNSGNVYVTGISHNGTNYDIRTIRYTPYDLPDIQGTIAGKVTNAGDGITPISGVKIEALKAGTTFVVLNAFADSQGNYSITLAPGVYDVRVSTAGEAMTQYNKIVIEDSTTTVTFEMFEKPKAWTKQLGTSGVGSGVSVDNSGNIYVAGYTNGGLDGNISAGSADIFLVKYDSSGNKLWTKQLGTGSADIERDVSIDDSGNIYLTGYTGGGLDGNTSAGEQDMFLVKYDSSGNKLWTKQLGSSATDYSWGVSADGAGNIYVTGTTYGDLDGNTSAGGQDIFLVKYDSSGNKLWTKQFGTGSADIGRDVSIDDSGNIYVTGYTYGGLDGHTNAGMQDMFLVKYDSSGTKQWTKQLGTSYEDVGSGVSVDNSGNIYVTGYTNGGLDGHTNAGMQDMFLVKYDSSGTKLWTKQLGAGCEDAGWRISLDGSGNIYVTGYTYGGLDLDGNTSAGGIDVFLVKYDSAGNKQWTKQLGTGNDDSGHGLSTDGSGNIYVTGWTRGGLDGNTSAGVGEADMFLVKFGSVTVFPTIHSAPTGFAGTSPATTTIMWSWTDTSNNEDGFRILTDTGGLVIDLWPNTTFWTETGLSPNTQYSRYVEAYNTAGNSQSESMSIYTLANPPVETQITAVTSNTITIEWLANGNPEGTQYEIHRSTEGTIFTAFFNVYTTSYTDTGLTPATTYWYQVCAINGDGIPSQFDTPVSTVTSPTEIPAGGITGNIYYAGTNAQMLAIAVWITPQPEEDPYKYITVSTSNAQPWTYNLTDLEDGTYYVWATFMKDDDSGPQKYDAWGVWGSSDNPTPVNISAGNPATDINITLINGTEEHPNPLASDKETSFCHSQHFYEGNKYAIQFGIKTSTTVTSVDVTGPGIQNSLALEYDADWDGGGWVSWHSTGSPQWEGTAPILPVTYYFTLTETTGTTVMTDTADYFIDYFAEPVLPINNDYIQTSTPVFVWNAPDIGNVGNYGIEVRDLNGNNVWNYYDMKSTQTSIAYNYNGTATPLTAQKTYIWNISIQDKDNSSFSQQFSFVYPGTAPVEGTITGYVRNKRNSYPAENVLIEIIHQDTPVATTLTDASGWYSVAVGTGTYNVRASKISHYEPAIQGNIIVNAFSETQLDFQLAPHQYAVSQHHWSDIYKTEFSVKIPSDIVTAIHVTGPGITEYLDLVYDSVWNGWVSWLEPARSAAPQWTGNPPQLPLEYTFEIIEQSTTTYRTSIIYNYVEFAMPTNPGNNTLINTSTPVFVWNAPTNPQNLLGIEVYQDPINNMVWNYKWMPSTQTFIEYNVNNEAIPLVTGNTYRWEINTIDGFGNTSFSEKYYFVVGATDSAQGIIAGKVNQYDGITPMDGALVEVSESGLSGIISSVTTDINGNYSLLIDTGVYDIRASSYGYEQQTMYGYEVSASSTTTVNFALQQAILNAPMEFNGIAESSNSILWQWYDQCSIEDGFRVRTDTDGLIIELPADTTTWLETGLDPNTSYTRYVEAYKGSYISSEPYGNSTYTLANPPVNTAVVKVSSLTIELGWSSNGNPSGTQYSVEMDTEPTFSPTYWSSGWVTETSYEFIGLEPDTVYYFRVQARNGNNTTTTYDSIVSTKTPDITPPGKITPFSAATGAQIQLNWTTPGDNGYTGSVISGKWLVVYSSNPAAAPETSEGLLELTTSYTPLTTHYLQLTNVQPRTTYYIWIRAQDDDNNWSVWSDTVSAISGSFVMMWASLETEETLFINWVDYDNDGDLDLAVGNVGTNKIYRNNGDETFTMVWESPESERSYSISWGDYNNDGFLDQLVGNDGKNRIYKNNGNGTFTMVWESPESEYSHTVSWGDCNNDGYLDQLVGNVNLPNRVYRNNGNGTFTMVWQSLESEQTHTVTWGDYNNDGFLDQLVGNDGKNRIYKNNGNGTFTMVWESPESEYTIGISWGDYDNDGYLDYAEGNHGTATGNTNGEPTRIYRNNGNGTFTMVWKSAEKENNRDIAWGDYDNDGDLDLLIGNYGHPDRVYRNNDDGTFTMIWKSPEAENCFRISWGDYDNDGDLDISVGNSWQHNKIYKSLEADFGNVNSAPTAPTIFNSTIAQQSGHLQFRWNDGSDTETSRQKGLYYNIRVGTSPTPSKWVVSPSLGAGTSPFLGNYPHGFVSSDTYQPGLNLKDVIENTTYYWQVQTIDTGLRSSPWSASQTAYVPTQPPAAPTGLFGVALSTVSIKWEWNITPGATYYNLYDNFDGSLIASLGGNNATSWIEIGLSSNTRYKSYVEAGSEAGLSGHTETASCYTLANPPYVLNAVAVSSSQINLSWNDSGASKYEVQYSTVWPISDKGDWNYVARVSSPVLTYNHTGLNPATTYYYLLIAINGHDYPNLLGEDPLNMQPVASAMTMPYSVPYLGAISGNLTYGGTNYQMLAVAVWTTPQPQDDPYAHITVSTIGTQPWEYSMPGLPSGAYYVWSTFLKDEDAGPRKYDAWGVWGSSTNPVPVYVTAGSTVTGIDMMLVDGTDEQPNPLAGDQSGQERVAWSQHWPEGYYVQFGIQTSTNVTSVSVSGPGITDSLNLVYDQASFDGKGGWVSWLEPANANVPHWPTTPPTPPLIYSCTIIEPSTTTYRTTIVENWVEQFATNLYPTGIITSTPTFSWLGVEGNYKYGVYLNNQDTSVWDRYNLTQTSIFYDGPGLSDGTTYYYNISVNDNYGSASFAKASFLYWPSAPQHTGGTISGTVKDYLNNPVLNAKIEITRSQNPDSPQDCVEIATTVFSGPGGFYSASDLPEGTYRAIRCLPPDGSVLAIQWVENVTVTAGQTITKDIILPQAGTISGKVVDANNNPLQGIGLHVEAPEGHYRFCGTGTQTDSNGNYTISYAPSGVWELNVHPFENSPYAEKRISNISVSAAQITTVNITLSIAGTIKGQVVDYNAIPVQGVKIEIWSQNAENVGRSTYTDSGGNYFISGLLPGIYNGEFKPPETRTDLVRKRINDIYSVEGETFTLNITLQAGAMISGNISSWPLTGTLAEGTTGYTILAFDSDISFTLENINNLDQSAETRVNSYGGYEITVPSGTYDLYLMSFAENPYDDWDACAAHGMTGNISVTSGEVKSGINITGSIGTGLISGSVSTSDGGGISGGKDISVLMTDANNKFAGMSQINITPAYPNQGTYRIKNLAAGSYNVLVCVQGTGYLPISDTISIGLGETIKDFVISKPVATGVIAGKVTKSDGTTGISGALVEALTADGSQLIVASTTTDIDGNYSIILATGSYDVRASSFCYEHKTVYDSAVFDSSTTVVNFSLSPAPLNPPMGLYGAAKSTGSIMWQWMDNSDNEDGFWVKTVDGSQLIELEPNTTYWLETGLSPNTSYGRYVEAYNGVGIASEPYPTYKHTLAAHPSNTKITHRSSNTITIEWSANGNPEGTQYKVYHSRDAEIPEMEPMSDYVMSTTCVVGFYMPLEPSTLYYIKVKAENAEYIPSWFDSIVSTMTLSIDQPVPVIYLDGEGFDVNTGSTASWGSGADFSYTTAFGGKDIEIWNGGIKDLGPVDSDSVMIFDNTGSEPGHISPVSGNIYTFLSDDGKATKIKVTNVSVEPDKIEFIFVYDYAPVSRTSGTITGSLAYTGEQTGAYTVGVSTSYDFTGTVYGTTTAPGNTFEITGIPIILDNYYVISFVDVNGNSKPDNTEPWNVNYWYTNPGPQRISEPVSTDIGTLYLYDFGEISGHVTNTSTQTGTVLIRAEGTYTTDYSAAYEKTITADADTGNYTIFVATPSNPYKIIAWIDGNANGAQDPGEYFTETTQPLNVSADSPLTGININITGDNYTSPMPPIFFAGESVSSESIIWSWQDVSGNEDGFRVKTDTSGTIAELGSSTTYYIETGLLPNTSYSRYVEAYNMAGSSRSETASRFTLASIPINTNILQVTSNTITIGWSANGNPINTEYEIQRSLNNTDYMPIISNYTMFQYTDTDVVPATTYWYKISATNGNGIPTEFGTTISTATQNADAGPAPYIISTIPADLDTNISVNIQYIDLVFNTYVTPVDNTAIGTHLRLKNADDGTDYTSRLASFTFLAGDMYRIELTNVNLSTGTTYIVEVSNFENTNGIKMSSDSFKFTTEIVSISTGTVPDGPTELKATERTTESIKWTWKDNANNETGYQILDFNLKPDTGTINMMHPPVVTDLPENSVEWTETGLMPNTKYIRSVAAYNEFGSSNSAKVSAYTFANMPTNFVCSAKTFESLTLEWYTNNNPANTKYILKRSTDGINYSELSIPDIMPPLDSFMGLTTFIDTGLQQETTYYYLLHAVNNADGSKTNPVRLTVQTSASSSSGPIAGKVTQSNGEPITGVWVQLFTTEGTTEIEGRFTEPDGSFEFKDIADGVYMLMCSWFVNDIESVVYKTGITENTVEEIFTLEIQYQLASLYGNLTIGTRPNFAGKFAPGLQPYVELLLRSKVVAKVNTDSEGNYMIPNLLPGKYVIRAFNGIQMSEPQECDVKEGQKLAMNFKWSLGLVKDDVFAYPNPARNKKITFRYKAINASHKTRIKIYTISGELVKEIKDEQINRTAAPKYEFEWDLKNNNNREIASGVYIYIVEIKQTVEPYEKVIIKKKFAIIK